MSGIVYEQGKKCGRMKEKRMRVKRMHIEQIEMVSVEQLVPKKHTYRRLKKLLKFASIVRAAKETDSAV